MDVMREAEAERAALLGLLVDLDDAEWATPSLCAGWTVRDVIAHVLSYEGVGAATIASRVVRGLGRFDRMNALSAEPLRDASPTDLVDLLRAHPRPTGLTAAAGGRIGLVDCLVHQQDVRRPLGRPREIPAERLRFALGFAVTAPPLRGFWHVRGTRVVATDLDWSHGRGPEARGPAEAVLMTLAGRGAATHDLAGPGAGVLRRRLDG